MKPVRCPTLWDRQPSPSSNLVLYIQVPWVQPPNFKKSKLSGFYKEITAPKG